MANVMANPTNFAPGRINQYVPGMKYSADVNYNAGTRVNFGAPTAASANNVANAVNMTTAGTTDLSAVLPLPEPYGRTVSYVAAAASTGTVNLNGYDYLGQPMSEQITLNGATPVAGKKAFKYFRNVTYTASATTLSIGSAASLGLPYKAVRCQFETANQALVAPGTLVAPVLTDPQTATTGDPRGTYTPTTAFDGTTVISAIFDMQNDVNLSNRGGLYGIPQFTN
jgi:hypothetical protein